MIQPQRHGHIDAHLGFLQHNHRYLVEFAVPWNLCIHDEGSPKPPAVVAGEPNPNSQILEFSHEKDNLRLKIELFAHKEKILKEVIEIMCCGHGEPLKIWLNARVLGKDKGTPLLRNGIRNIGVEDEED
ncbi:adipose-secreted signaling protein isoform X2 [Prorops nasuta]